MNHTCKIIIIGTSHHNTLSMVRSFGEEGLKVSLYIYGTEDSYIAGSVYIESVSYFITADEAIDSVSLFASKEAVLPVVIACSDEVSSLMDMRYNELVGKCHFFNAGEKGRITKYMDKQKQLELAKSCGLLVPSSIDSLPRDVKIDSINYPCFVKPKTSIYGGKKIAICHSQVELQKKLATYNPEYNVLVQDYIRKEYEIVILGLTVEGKSIIPGFIQKHREALGGTTYSTVRPISELKHSVVEACKQLIVKIGYQGLWGIECIKNGDEYYFIELNMRNDATTYAMKVAGVNLPHLYLKMVESNNYQLDDIAVKTINSMVEFNDFNFVLKRKIGLLKWISEYKNSECKYFHSSADPSPCKRMKVDYIKFLCKRIFKH